jgi:hypothetical protein
MTGTFMKKQFVLMTLFLGSLVCFYLLNHFTDLAIDDFAYKSLITNDPERIGQRVNNLSDLVHSQYNHYLGTNGRIFVSGLTQLFLIPEEKVWFNIANVLMFAFMQLLILTIAGITLKELSVAGYLLFLAGLWFLLPGPNHSLLWISGSFNYLWAAVIVLSFLYILRKYDSVEKRSPFYLYPLFFIGGFLSGATHEVISLGVSGALFFYYVFHMKRFRGAIIPLVIGFFLGTLFIAIAPANLSRFHSGGPGEATGALMILQKFWAFILSVPSMILPLSLIFALALLFKRDRIFFREIIQRHSILLLSTMFSLVFILFVGSFQPRVFFGVSVFSVIILISVIHKYSTKFQPRSSLIVSGIVGVAMLIEFVFVTITLKQNKVEFDRDELSWRSSTDNVFEMREKKLNRFVSTGLGGSDRYFWSNIVMSWYYGKEYMIFLPKHLYQNLFLAPNMIHLNNRLDTKITMHDSIQSDLYLSPDSNFLAVPVSEKNNEEVKPDGFVEFDAINPIVSNELDIRQKVVKYVYGRMPAPVAKEKVAYHMLSTKQGTFLYFETPPTIPLDKLKTVQIE